MTRRYDLGPLVDADARPISGARRRYGNELGCCLAILCQARPFGLNRVSELPFAVRRALMSGQTGSRPAALRGRRASWHPCIVIVLFTVNREWPASKVGWMRPGGARPIKEAPISILATIVT